MLNFTIIISTILSIVLLTTHQSFGQRILFKPQLKPNKIYHTTIENNGITDVFYSGSEEIMQRFSQNGAAHHLRDTSRTFVESVMQTSDTLPNGRFRMVTHFIKHESHREQKAFSLQGVKIYSTSTTEMDIQVDSITGDISDELKTGMVNGFKMLASSNIFPNKELTVGDTFLQVLPMTYPITTESSLDLNLIMTYFLDSLTQDLAIFRINQQINMTLNIVDSSIQAEGEGTGTLHFSLIDFTNQLYETTLNIRTKFTIGELHVQTSSLMHSKNQTLVE